MACPRSGALLTLALGLLACGPEPYAEALVVVDTDLAVPRLVNRLRVDLYTEQGQWFESRDFGRPTASDWPVSFSVISQDESQETFTLLRLRAYAAGKIRDYRGERFEGPVHSFDEPACPQNLAQMCEAPPKLSLGGTVTLRRRREPIFGALLGCGAVATGGAAAYVDIATPGSYRFAVVAGSPPGDATVPPHTMLQFRTTCTDPQSFLVCDDGLDVTQTTIDWPDVEVTLQPGRYFVLLAGIDHSPADFTLAAAPSDQWHTIQVPTEAPPPPIEVLLNGDPELTPATEPLPGLTVDRLVGLRLVPGEPGRARLTLRGACLGTMAALTDHQGVAPGVARTCVGTEAELVAVEPAVLDEDMDLPAAGASLQGSFGIAEPCDVAAVGDLVCVPGGTFVLGGPQYAGHTVGSSAPERVVQVPRFWMDRYEVTVRRWRKARQLGLQPGTSSDEPLEAGTVPHGMCSWTATAGSNEDLALTCISWYGARDFCRFHGGDLPTEAQWEYAAGAAGRAAESLYREATTHPSATARTARKRPAITHLSTTSRAARPASPSRSGPATTPTAT